MATYIPQSKLINDNTLNDDIRQKTAILVPVSNYIEEPCDSSLRQLESEGIKVYRQYGFSAIDQGRCVMAQIALNDGYEHLLWVDSDISFYYKDVYKIINRNKNNEYPFITAAYCVKGWPVLTTRFFDNKTKIHFGERTGGMYKIKWGGTGFMYTHKSVYENIKLQYNLKPVMVWGGQYVVHTWFFPMIIDNQYVGEDFSFCERANNSGIEIYCDTTIKLGHVGKYSFSYGYITKKAPEKEPSEFVYLPGGMSHTDPKDCKKYIQYGHIL